MDKRIILILLIAFTIILSGCITTGNDVLRKPCTSGTKVERALCFTDKAAVYAMRGDITTAVAMCKNIQSIGTDIKSFVAAGYSDKVGYNYCITRVAVITKNKTVCNYVERYGTLDALNKIKSAIGLGSASIPFVSKDNCLYDVQAEIDRENELTDLWNRILNPGGSGGGSGGNIPSPSQEQSIK